MKIGILTLLPGCNYGGIMQTFALQTVLERMGHEVSVLTQSLYLNEYDPLLILKIPLRFLIKLIKRDDRLIFAEKYCNKNRKFRFQKMEAFTNRYLNLYCVKSFEKAKNNNFDVIVVGSDQVWRPKYFETQYHTKINNAFLEFAKKWNIKRFSYSASFGVENWEYSKEQTIQCASLLSKFDGISVREKTGVDLCKRYLKADAIQLCDPTMLLDKEDYIRLISPETPKSSGNLLVYCLDKNEKLDLLVERLKNKGMVPFYTNEEEIGISNKKIKQKPSVESWIRGFMDADFVVTDSFHACIFSLIFKKPFVVIGNKERGMTRFESLLEEFGESDRLLYNIAEYSSELESISNKSIEDTIKGLRVDAFEFLRKIK